MTFNKKSTAEHRVWINPLHCVNRQGNYAEKVQTCALIDKYSDTSANEDNSFRNHIR